MLCGIWIVNLSKFAASLAAGRESVLGGCGSLWSVEVCWRVSTWRTDYGFSEQCSTSKLSADSRAGSPSGSKQFVRPGSRSFEVRGWWPRDYLRSGCGDGENISEKRKWRHSIYTHI